MALLAVTMHQRRRPGLIALLDGGLGQLKQTIRIFRLDAGKLVGLRMRLLVLSAILPRRVECPANEAGERVPRVANPRDVAPGVSRIGRMDADGRAVDTADGLARLGAFPSG